MDKIPKEVKYFCEQNLSRPLTKRIALFMCCTTLEQANDYFKTNFSAQLLNHTSKTLNFAGELRRSKMGLFDKGIN